MNDTNYPLNFLFTEAKARVVTLKLLNQYHELTAHYAENLSLDENHRFLVWIMKRFCPDVKNPALPTQYELFIALRSYVTALDDAILTDLLQSIEAVLKNGLVIEDAACKRLIQGYKVFSHFLEGMELARQSTLHI